MTLGRAGRLVLLACGMILAFSLSLVAAYSIPDAAVRGHMKASLAQLDAEGYPYIPFMGLRSLTLDNYGDAVILNEAIDVADEDPVRAAFSNNMRVAEMGSEGDPGSDLRPMDSLRMAVAGEGGRTVSYARYWHGVQVLVRPALVLFDYRGLRYLNLLLLIGLAVAAIAAVAVRLGPKECMAFVGALLVVGVPVVPMSITLSSVFALAFAGVVVVLRMAESPTWKHRDIETFLVIGALAAFFDRLTSPLLTLGLPLMMLLLLRMRSESESRQARQLAVSARLAASWLTGFSGIWLAKWVLSAALLRSGVVANGIGATLHRIGLSAAAPPIEGALERNVAMMFPIFGFTQAGGIDWSMVALASAVSALPILVLLFLAVRRPRRDGKRGRVLAIMPLALAPYVWYCALSDHSWIHYWFTYREQVVTLFALFFGLLYVTDPEYLRHLSDRISRWAFGAARRYRGGAEGQA